MLLPSPPALQIPAPRMSAVLEETVIWLGQGREEGAPSAELRAHLVLQGIDPKAVRLRVWRVQAKALRSGHLPHSKHALRAAATVLADGLLLAAPWEGGTTGEDRLLVEVFVHHRRVAWAVAPLQERRRREDRPQPAN